MLRRMLCSLLKAELNPSIDWTEIHDEDVLTRESVPAPMLFSRSQTLEQVLCKSGEVLTLYARWSRAGSIRRVRFSGPLDGRGMRITDCMPGESPIFRMSLPSNGNRPVVYDMCHPTWFRLWRNEPTMNDLGSGICFIDSTNRESLVKLRSQLLGGNVPEALRNEEAMWEKMNSLPESDRRAALAALVTQQLQQLDRGFDEAHPDPGPLPDELKPLNKQVERQLESIRRMAAENSVDPELAKLMQEFTREAHERAMGSDGAG